MRFMTLYKPGKESDAPPSQQEMAAMGQLIEEMAFTVTDGPFTETKELVAGYAIIQAKSKEEAIELTKRFLKVVGEGESEIRLMHDAPAFDSTATSELGRAGERQPAKTGANR